MVERLTGIQHIFATVTCYIDQNTSANNAFFTQWSNARLGQGTDSGIGAVAIPNLIVVPDMPKGVVLS
ncbi:hypothetical protein D3C78_1661760 [compost metagenome]